MNPPSWTPEHQYEIWARNVGRATRDLVELFTQADTVHQLALDRLQSGLMVFKGDARWSAMSHHDLRYEALEEAADALNYQIWTRHTQEDRND